MNTFNPKKDPVKMKHAFLILLLLFAAQAFIYAQNPLCSLLLNKSEADKSQIAELETLINSGADVNCDCLVKYSTKSPNYWARSTNGLRMVLGLMPVGEWYNTFRADDHVAMHELAYKPLDLVIRNNDLLATKFLVEETKAKSRGETLSRCLALLPHAWKPELAYYLLDKGASLEYLPPYSIEDIAVFEVLVKKYKMPIKGRSLSNLAGTVSNLKILEANAVDLNEIEMTPYVLKNVEVLNYLVFNKGIDLSEKKVVESFPKSVLYHLVSYANDKSYNRILLWLLEKGYEEKEASEIKLLLRNAIAGNNCELFESVIEQNLKLPYDNEAVDEVIEGNKTFCVNLLCKMGYTYKKSFMLTTAPESDEMVEALLLEGWDVNKLDPQKLSNKERPFDTTMINKLIEWNFDFNLWIEEERGFRKPIELLYSFHKEEFIFLLKRAKINPNILLATDYHSKFHSFGCKVSVLMHLLNKPFSFHREDKSLFYWMLKREADVNLSVECDGHQVTALFLAMKNDRWDLALKLLEAGADKNAKCGKNNSPLEYINSLSFISDRYTKEVKKLKKLLK